MANSDDPSLKKLVKQQNTLLNQFKNSIDAHATQVAALSTAFENGFASLSNSLSGSTTQLTNVVSAIGGVAAQLTAANTHAAQWNASFTEIAKEVAGVNSLLAASSKAQKKKVSSHETDPHGQPINLTSSAGIKAWLAGTTLPDSIPTGLLVTPDSKKPIRGLYNHLMNTGFASLLHPPDKTQGNGLPGTSPLPDGSANTNLKGARNMLTHYVNMTEDDILAWSAWIHGDVDAELTVPTGTRVQKTVDIDATGRNGNDGKVAQVKIDHRTRASMLMHIFRNHIDPDSLEAFLAQKDLYTWTRADNGTEFHCGVTIAWLILVAIEPKTVIDAKEFETTIYETTLINDCQGDVKKYLSILKIAKDQLDIRHPGRMTKDKYFETIFREVQTIKPPHFKPHVDMEFARYLRGDLKDIDTFLKELDGMYTALSTAKTWSIHDPNDKKMIAMATQMKQLKADNKKLKDQFQSGSKTSPGGGGKSTGDGPYFNDDGKEVAGPKQSIGYNVLLWRTKKTTQTVTRDGRKWHWCNDPAHYDGNGLYMLQNADNPGRHDHAEWAKEKERRKAERKKKADDKKRKKGGDDSSVGSSSSTKTLKGNLTVKKPKKEAVNALVTQHNWDHHQALEFCAAHGMMTDGEESGEDFQ